MPSGLVSRVVATDRLVVVVAPGHPWARRRTPLLAAELAATPLVVREQGSGTRETLDLALTGHVVAAPKLELGSNAAVKGAAREGAAPAVLSGYAVEAELATGRLIEVPTRDIDLARRLRAVWRRGRTPSGPAATLLKITLSAAERPEPPASPSPQPAGSLVLRSRYEAVIVGGGHNGLVAAAYLARAGRRVLVLERLDHVGGLAVSARAFPGVDARLSRYSYLVSLLPAKVVADLGLNVTLRRRRYASYTPVGESGLLVDNGDAARTAASFARVTGGTGELDAWRRFYRMTADVAGKVAPTLLEPSPTARRCGASSATRRGVTCSSGRSVRWWTSGSPTTPCAGWSSPTPSSAPSPTPRTRACRPTGACSTT